MATARSTKGEWHRPYNKEKFDSNYDAIFGKKDKPSENTAKTDEKSLSEENKSS